MKKPYKPGTIPINKLAWAQMIPHIGMAQAAVARFDGILHAMINPELLLSPLTTQEAVWSSRIEGTQASLEDVLRQDVAPRKDAEHKDDIQEVQNYREAMTKAVPWLRKSDLDFKLICRIHKVLLTGVRGEGKRPGTVRTTQNHIGYRGEPVEKALFIPPTPQALHHALPEFESFMAATHRDVIVQTAMAHAQFELLHPFLDGNGRVGRMLVPLLLHAKGLMSSPTFYISEYFEEHRPTYYNKLAAVSENGDWQGWVDFFLKAVTEQAELNTGRAGAILKLYNGMKEEINQATRSQYALQTLDALFAAPFLTKADFVQRSGIALRTGERLLPELESAGILRVYEKGAGRRPTIYAFQRLIDITGAKGNP
ncbi:MAG: Fic family protein [Lentisphaerae bacterium]|nr:Fic family protein [Lentisphaerota bacterium]